MSQRRGLNAYLAEQANYEKTGLSEPDALIDEMRQRAESAGLALQEKSTLKHLVGTDLRHQMPPQMFAVVSSLARLIERVEESPRAGRNSQEKGAAR